MSGEATTRYGVHDLISKRWSPTGIDPDRSVAKEDLLAMLEAARWAPSSYNEQPWRYIVATKDDAATYEKVLASLVEPNQEWARNAPVLALGVASLHFERNGKPNHHALHDLGAASMGLSAEATARGLVVHQMAGILPDKAKEAFAVPDGYEVVTGLAIGYAVEDPSTLPDGIRQRDEAPRSRKPMHELFFTGAWGQPLPGTED